MTQKRGLDLTLIKREDCSKCLYLAHYSFGSVRFGLPITNILLSKALFCSFVPSVSGFIRCCVGSLVGDGFLGLLHLVLLCSTLVLLSCQTAT